MPVRPLSPALKQKALIELGENTDVLESSIRELKEWIATQPHLRARTDDQWLAAFLRGCKFRLDQVKTKIDLYYTLRSTAPDLYAIKYNDSKVIEILELGCTMFLPKLREPAAPRIALFKFGNYNPKEHSVINIMAVSTFQYQISFMEDDNLTVAGVISLMDVRNTHIGHYLQVSLKQIRNFVSTHQDAVPIRLKEVHFIGVSYTFATILNFAKRFLSDKIKNRFYMHSNVESLHKHIPKDILPAEYGGTGPTMGENIDYWKRKFNDNREFFEEDLQYGTDETRRVKKDKK